MSELHPVAVKCLHAVEPKEPGDASQIAPDTLKALVDELKKHRQEREIFEHLCVLAYRLHEGGLQLASDQLLSLARIGLDAGDLEATMNNEAKLKQEAERLGANDAKLKGGSKLAGGLAPKGSATLSVGIKKR